MPEASGSIAFLGAARFQGYWDAATNAATGSGVTGTPTGPIGALFASGTSAGGGYSNYDGLTASVGDYWQVTGSGTHNVDGFTSWNLNDWVIYSGSAGAAGSWLRLDYADTIASIVLGDLSGESVFNLTGSSDKQVLFITGASDTDVVQSGSDNFSFDYINSNLHLTGNLSISDNKKLYFGSDHDASIEYDEDGTDELRFAGNAATFEQDVTFDNDVTLGVAASDVTTVTGRLTASVGAMIPDDVKLYFGDSEESHIEYNENGDDHLTLSGTVGVVVSGSSVVVDSSTAVIKAPTQVELATDQIWIGENTTTDPKISFIGAGGSGHIHWDSSDDSFVVEDKISVSGSVQISGSAASTTFLMTLQNAAASGEFIDLVGGQGNSSIQLRQGTNGDGMVYVLNDSGSPRLLLEGGAGTGRIYFYDQGGEHIEGDGTNLTVTAGGVIELSGSSVGVPDDTRLTFGNAQEAHIEYDEAGEDYLSISGSAKGVVLSGSIVKIHTGGPANTAAGLDIDTNSVEIGSPGSGVYPILQFKGNSNTGQLSWLESLDAFGFYDDIAITDNERFYFGSDFDSYISYTENDDNYLTIKGKDSYGIVLTGSTVEVDGRLAVGRASTETSGLPEHTISVTGTLGVSGDATLSGNIYAADDKKLYFGNDNDAYIEYDHSGDSFMHISGSGKGMVLSGSDIILDTTNVIFSNPDILSGTLATTESYLGLSSAGRLVVTSSSTVGTITALNNQSESRLVTIGSTTTELDGEANLTYNGTTFTINDDVMLKDDHKFYFGTHSDAYIQYRETGDDYLTISGSANGVAISGSSVIVDGNLLPNADAVTDLGSASRRWANIYTGDLHLRNERGDWTIVEEEDYLTIVNNKKGKKYKFVLEEID